MANSITRLLLIVAVLVSAAPLTAAAAANITCGQVSSTLAPCYEYVLGGGEVPGNCCAGVKSLYKAASTTADRRSVCNCLKSITTNASPAAFKNAETLPGKCGVSLPFEITPAVDCKKVP